MARALAHALDRKPVTGENSPTIQLRFASRLGISQQLTANVITYGFVPDSVEIKLFSSAA